MEKKRIDAIVYDGSNVEELKKFHDAGKYLDECTSCYPESTDNPVGKICAFTDEKRSIAIYPGDAILYDETLDYLYVMDKKIYEKASKEALL